MLIAYFRILRGVVIDKTQHESEERLVTTLPGACPLFLGTHWLVHRGECHTVARDSVCTEIAASTFLNTLLGSTSFPRISELSQVLHNRVLKSIAASSWPIFTIATI